MKIDRIQHGEGIPQPALDEAKVLLKILEEYEANFPTETNTLLALLDNRSMNLTIMLNRLTRKERPEEIKKIRDLIYFGIDEAEALVPKQGKDASNARLKKLVDDIAEIWKEFQL